MFNILYVSHEAGLTGAPISLFSLIKRLNRKRFNPFFVCPGEGKLVERLREIEVPVQFLKHPYSLYLCQFIRNKKIDLVHTNTSVTFYGALAGKMAGRQVIWHIREDLSQGVRNKMLVKIINSLSNRIIGCSQSVGKVFKKSEKCVTIYNGVDLKEFNPKILPLPSLSHPLIGFVGSIEPRKGISYFLLAAKEINKTFPETRFWVVGSPLPGQKRYLLKMEKFSRKLGLEEKLRFLGRREDIPQIMASFDILALPSLVDPLPRVVMEAMSLGKPVVATRVGGIPEMVEDGVTGYLVPPSDPHSLSRAVIKLLKDEEKSGEMGKTGRRRVEKLFSLEKNAEETIQVYESLLNA